MKRLLKRSEDLFISVMNYNATPMPWCNLSPSELLMGRKMRSTLPQLTENLIPKWPFLKEFQKRNLLFKQKQKQYYDLRHRTHPQHSLEEDDDVWVSIDGNKVPGRVMGPAHTHPDHIL